MTRRLDQEIQWLGIRFRVPADWQIVRHGLKPEAGRLVWVDRRRERFTLAWTHFHKRPDLGHLVADYRALLAKEHPGCALRELRGAPAIWRGLTAERDGADDVLTRAALWDEPGSRLLEVVAFTRRGDAAEAGLATELMCAIEPAARPEAARRWRAFDIDVAAPEGVGLVELSARPADTTFTFRKQGVSAARGGTAEATLHRFGMADAWHDGNLDGVLRRKVNTRFEQVVRSGHGGRRSLLATGNEPGPRWRRALGWLRVQRSLVWECPPENAVYVLTTRSPRESPLLPTDFEVRCKESVT